MTIIAHPPPVDTSRVGPLQISAPETPSGVQPRTAGVNVALSVDWTPSGSRGLLEELRFAQQLNLAQWSGALDAELMDQLWDAYRQSTPRTCDFMGVDPREAGPTFLDGFESGTTGEWSTVMP